jgi:N-acetyl-anhydromuramyl-L-alanine amidase AmpD
MPTKLPATEYKPIGRIQHGRRPVTNGVVIHDIEGGADGAFNYFSTSSPQGVGAHVIVGQKRVVQAADLDQICYHAINANSTKIGIEHEGYASYSKAVWLKSANRHLLRSSANRTAWICWHYKLGTPKHGRNVFGHYEIPGNDHVDPGKGWPWTFYMWLCVRAYKNLVKKGKWA